MATESLLTVLTVSGIAGTSTGATLIQTTDAGLRFVPMFIQVEATNVSGLVTPASFSIGTNGANYNNLLAITAMTGVTSANIMLQNNITALSSSIPASTGININVTTAAVGTTYTLRVSIIGFYY